MDRNDNLLSALVQSKSLKTANGEWVLLYFEPRRQIDLWGTNSWFRGCQNE
ncbi:predicted protein [Plenodomus lingam JN3]|uniref:Predicted protein n=1 Tax=Leptosphaeria maculans (strain JN3 / isolate v23.1.3 / race Av1-4-5-6-7-8) TaxID=985895 RepID=E4ZPM6_LEPMJ|nr:predicted protein [Plenodomus lingam JN3]CBX93411.1 predicted protein [Plenodomus lingam JN3]